MFGTPPKDSPIKQTPPKESSNGTVSGKTEETPGGSKEELVGIITKRTEQVRKLESKVSGKYHTR